MNQQETVSFMAEVFIAFPGYSQWLESVSKRDGIDNYERVFLSITEQIQSVAYVDAMAVLAGWKTGMIACPPIEYKDKEAMPLNLRQYAAIERGKRTRLEGYKRALSEREQKEYYRTNRSKEYQAIAPYLAEIDPHVQAYRNGLIDDFEYDRLIEPITEKHQQRRK